jgi:hypothetical protein
MELNSIFGILGIAATVMFGGLSVYLFVTRRYPGQITFIREDAIALFDSIVKNFPDLKVLYQDRPVTEGLVLLKGAFVNTGSKDITPDMVAEPVKLALPDGFRWCGARIISHSPDHHGTLTLGEQEISCHTAMFRCGEHVRFEAVAEVPVQNRAEGDPEKKMERRLVSALKLTHRIADTQEVKVRDFPDEMYARRRLKRFRVPLIMFALLVLFLLGMYLFACPAEVLFTIPREGRQIEVTATPRTDGSVRLKGTQEKGFRETVTAQEFFATPGLHARTAVDWSSLVITSAAVLLNLILLAGFVFLIYRMELRQW